MIRNLSLLLLGTVSSIEGTVLLFDPPDIGFYSLSGTLISQNLDLDSDGIDDIQLRSDRASFQLLALRDNTQIATLLTGGNDIGGNAIPYIAGDLLGAALPTSAVWFSSSQEPGASTLNSCRDIGCIGFWREGINYAGVRIEDDEGDFRYAWLEIDAQISGITGGVLTRYAFETEANRPITVIPEPSSMLCVLLGLSTLLRRQR